MFVTNSFNLKDETLWLSLQNLQQLNPMVKRIRWEEIFIYHTSLKDPHLLFTSPIFVSFVYRLFVLKLG